MKKITLSLFAAITNSFRVRIAVCIVILLLVPSFLNTAKANFVSATAIQTNTTTVAAGTTNAEVIGVAVTVDATGANIVNYLRFCYSGTNVADVTNANIYYTGTSNTFATTKLVGGPITAITTCPTTFNINLGVSGDTLPLVAGTYYFWLTFDVLSGATVGDNIDAQCLRVKFNALSNNLVSPASDPAGNRIIGCGINVTIASQLNVSCNGGSNGSVTASPNTGTPPYTYSWSTSPVQTTISATGLSATTYSVLVTDNSGCVGSTTVSITQPVAITTTVVTTNTACGGNTGTAVVNVSGGTAPYTYGWMPGGQTTQLATGLAANVYTVTVNDANGCSKVATGTVSATGGPTVTISSQTNVSCNGGNNGSATSSATGGTLPYTYSWSPSGGTTSAATGLSANIYTILVTDGGGCTSTASVNITQPSPLSVTVTATGTSCGGNNGSATANVTGGTLNYSYSWNPSGGTTSSATGLVAGNYTVTITDGNSCTAVGTGTVAASSGPSVSISASTNVSCFGGNNGSASSSVSGGQTPYTYSWTPSGGNTANATGLTATNYTVAVTDAFGCKGSATVAITQPTVLTASVSTTTSTCGNSTGSATANVSGGTTNYTYAWNNGQSTQTATGLAAGSYTVTVTDANGCTKIASGTVINSNGPTVSIASQINVSCFGGNNGSANSSVTGGTLPYTYLWSTSPFQQTPNATGLSATTYTVLVADATSCTSTATVTITQPTAITATVTTTNSTCGNNNGTASAFVSGGVPSYTYNWSSTPAQTTANATGLGAGNYFVTITDANGCTLTTTCTVNNTSGPSASVASQTNVSCNGGSDGSATALATGGTSPFTYSWNSSPVQMTATATGLTAGNYTVTISDMNGCSSTATVAITQPAAITASITVTGTACGSSTGTATVNASGGTPAYTYLWSSGGQTTQTATGLSAGTYTVVVTDSKGCTKTASATVINSNGPTVSISSSTNVSCNGGNNGSATSSATGGALPYTYSWSPSGGTNAAATGLSAGVYTVTVADANGCTSVTTATITESTAITITVTTSNGNCTSSVGTATANVSGGTPAYTYAWSTVPAQNTSTATGLAAGTYTVLITDANGCTKNATATIVVANAPVASISSQTNVTCNGGSDGSACVSATGGTTPYTYSWSPSGQNGVCASNLSAGNYIVTVTDVNGCTSTASVTITQPNGMTTTMSTTSAACGNNNGSASVSVSGGTSPYTYSWSTSPVQITPTANGLFAGTYSVTVTDGTGCTKTSAVTIVNYNGPIASISAQTNVSCFGANNGSATATATGAAAPYTYVWNSSPAQTGATATGLSAAQYTVTVTDATGCISIAVVAITQPSAVSVSANSSAASCGTCCDAVGNASASGGTTPYMYSWSTSPVQTTASATGLCANATYTVCATDGNGCSACTTVIISNVTGISSSAVEQSFSIFPNPANDYLFVEGTTSASEKIEVSVINLFGQHIMKKYILASGKFSEKISTAGLPAGVYFMEIKSNDITRQIKFVIQ